MISIRDLRIDYHDTCAVDDLSLEIGPGEVFGLIGPNGAGKTSTMRALVGLLEPTYGAIEIDGVDVRDDVAVRHRVGFMPDFPPLYDDLLVWEFLDLFAASYHVPPAERSRAVDEHLELVGLGEKRHAMVAELSRGMRQRLMLAKTLLPQPSVLVLDEPASGVDPHGRIQLKQILRDQASRGRTVLVSSHILAEMAEFCTSVGIMERGKMVVSGAVDEVARRVTGAERLLIEVLDGLEICLRVLAAEGLADRAVEVAEGIEVAFEGDRRQASDLLAKLTAAGVRVASFARKRETLENVFLQVGASELS